MKRILVLFAAGALLVSCASTPKSTTASNASDPLAQVLAADPQVSTGTLANGFRYVIRKNTKPENRAELRLVVNVGSVLEDADQQGLAHFAEHMAFNGTKNFEKQELVDYLEGIGMRFGPDLNAYTSFDETVYMLQVPMDSTEVIETAFQILEDWAHQVSFEPEEIDKERGVVVEEWRLGRGANRRMFDEQLPILLKDSRYAERLPIGQKAVLDTFKHASLLRFYKTWYRPDLMGFVAVGDFEPAYMESLTKVYFSRLAQAQEPREREVFPVPGHEETLFAIASDPEASNNVVSIYTKQDVRDQSTAGAYRRSIIEGMYHRMLNQRLGELTKLPQPPFLGAGSSQGRWLRSKEFVSLGAAVQNNGFDAGLEALLTEAERVRQHGFTRSELSRTKKEMLRGMEQSFRERDKQESRGFAGEYVRHLLIDESIPGIEKEYALYQEYMPTITIEEVNALASEWNSGHNRVITVDAPEREGVAVPTEEELLAAFARVEGKEIEPYAEDVSDAPLVDNLPAPGAVVARDSIPELGVTLWTLSNGVRVQLKPTDFKNDEILFSSHSPGGHSLVGDEDYIAAATTSSVVREGGVGQFNQIDLGKKLAGKVVGVSPSIGSLQEGISGSASPQDVETMFELVYAYFTTPRADSTAFQALKKRIEGSIQNRNARPETAFGDTMQVTLASYHHRARPWSMELLEELSLEKSMAIYRDRFSDAGDFTFTFVGNFSLEQMEPLVCAYLATLPSTGREETWRDVGIKGPEGVVEKFVYAGIEPKSSSRVVFSGPFEFDGWANNFAIDAMAAVFQIKLREVLREGLGGTYGVGVRASVEHFPREEYSININFGSDPERVEELTQVVFEQIDSLKTVGTTQVYIDKVVEMRKRSREVNLKENSFWRGTLQGFDINGTDPLLVLKYDELVENLTPEMVQKAAQKYFNIENYARFVLYPQDFAKKDGN
ncbi:MAG: insulinase family protein [Candidatus Latescibacterota bacterium]|jgi:zinc protease